MTGHVILKGSEVMLSAERGEGAPEAIYGAECMTCAATSDLVDNDPMPVEVWAMEHARHYGLAHGRFLVRTERHWRVDPLHPGAPPMAEQRGGASPVVASAMTTDAQPRRSGAHARPRQRWPIRRAGVPRLADAALSVVAGMVAGVMPREGQPPP